MKTRAQTTTAAISSTVDESTQTGNRSLAVSQVERNEKLHALILDENKRLLGFNPIATVAMPTVIVAGLAIVIGFVATVREVTIPWPVPAVLFLLIVAPLIYVVARAVAHRRALAEDLAALHIPHADFTRAWKAIVARGRARGLSLRDAAHTPAFEQSAREYFDDAALRLE